ncbi:MAG: aminopeptidase P family protein [Candidatus Cloacimonetes bacterium]|nr:aminopeptidase P family protein [Candidatus Cloacimonadota bacterium]
MDKKLLTKRREKLAKKLKKDEIIIVFAASEKHDTGYFQQENNFLYLTGLEVPNAILIVYKGKEKPVNELFIERNIPEMVVWEGEKMLPEKAKEQSGIENISFLDEFERKIGSYLLIKKRCYINRIFSGLNSPLNKQQLFIKSVRDRFPGLTFEDFTEIIRSLRMIKDKWEIEQIRKAIDITAKGISKIFRNAKSGMMEYELEAILNYEITKAGMRHLGFKSIIAGGKNAATLHYVHNNSKIGKNVLILMDVGASCNNYSADISRTFPISGKFTVRQKAVYNEVLKINKKIIEMIKPGVGLKELNDKTVELIKAALIKLKLIKDEKDYKKYYMHSVSHHLGLDTHDIGKRDSILKAGNVITVEPGIYILDEKIGVRIEDDILVTKTGYQNLSENIPKEIEDLEH